MTSEIETRCATLILYFNTRHLVTVRPRRFHPGVPHQGHQIDKSVIGSFLSPMYRVILVTHGGRQEEKRNHLRGTTIISLISETA